eukprot:scaffold12401_cov133-Isochrysis_galbana.AAC.1
MYDYCAMSKKLLDRKKRYSLAATLRDTPYSSVVLRTDQPFRSPSPSPFYPHPFSASPYSGHYSGGVVLKLRALQQPGAPLRLRQHGHGTNANASHVTLACVARAATQAARDRCTLAPKYDAQSP